MERVNCEEVDKELNAIFEGSIAKSMAALLGGIHQMISRSTALIPNGEDRVLYKMYVASYFNNLAAAFIQSARAEPEYEKLKSLNLLQDLDESKVM